MLTALRELLFRGGHLIFTAPNDPQDLDNVATLVTLLSTTSLSCTGDVLAGRELGASSKTADAAPRLTQATLPYVGGQVTPLSCNFPGSTVAHHRSPDGYPTVVEWPKPLGPARSLGSIWFIGNSYVSNFTAWNQLLLDVVQLAGTIELKLADFSKQCASPCLTSHSELYYRDDELETQTVYDTSTPNCTALSRTRTCADGVFGPWSLSGQQFRVAPCDGTCQDNEYDVGARFQPGQTQVRVFFTSQYVSYGNSCASVAMARVRMCSSNGTRSFSSWSDGPSFTECFVQCPPPLGGETVAAYAPTSGMLGEGAVLNRTMYGSSVEDEIGGCLTKVLQRTCGKVAHAYSCSAGDSNAAVGRELWRGPPILAAQRPLAHAGSPGTLPCLSCILPSP
ncbi:hypothetical protein TSOC_011124, partial [Tetrabaena socialis]